MLITSLCQWCIWPHSVSLLWYLSRLWLLMMASLWDWWCSDVTKLFLYMFTHAKINNTEVRGHTEVRDEMCCISSLILNLPLICHCWFRLSMAEKKTTLHTWHISQSLHKWQTSVTPQMTIYLSHSIYDNTPVTPHMTHIYLSHSTYDTHISG